VIPRKLENFYTNFIPCVPNHKCVLFQMALIGEVSTWHSLIIGIASVLLNSLLLFTIWVRSLKSVGVFKYMMIATTLLDLMFSLIYIIASPVCPFEPIVSYAHNTIYTYPENTENAVISGPFQTIASLELLSSVIIVMGGFRIIPRSVGIPILIFFIFLLCQSIVTPPCLFVFRYLQICKANFLSMYHHYLRYLLIIPVLLSSACCALISFAAWPTKTDRLMFDEIAAEINVNWSTTYMVASFQKNATAFDRAQTKVLRAATVCLILMMIVAVALKVICSKFIVKAAERSIDRKTRSLQLQLYRTLIAQSAIPFFFIHVPFYVCVLAPLFNLDSGLMSDFMPFLFTWSPALNAIIVMFFVRDYRTFLLKRILCLPYETASNSVFQASVRKL
ncbi:7TM chemoreceptor, partial [Trichostrongylus colubriformis]